MCIAKIQKETLNKLLEKIEIKATQNNIYEKSKSYSTIELVKHYKELAGYEGNT